MRIAWRRKGSQTGIVLKIALGVTALPRLACSTYGLNYFLFCHLLCH